MAEKFMEYFEEFGKDDKDDVLTVCESASKVIWDRFRVQLKHPELVATIFGSTYYSILNHLLTFEKTKSEFEINLADRLLIGYSTVENDDDEKQGNFQIYIRHLNSTKKNDDIAEAGADTDERAVVWQASNIKTQPNLVREISIEAKKDLENLDIYLSSENLVIPLFISIYEILIVYLTTKRREADEFEYSINFVSCFEIAARETEDDLDEIVITPNVTSKLTLKDDLKATAKHEN